MLRVPHFARPTDFICSYMFSCVEWESTDTSGRAPTPLGHHCSLCENFTHTKNLKLKHNGIWGWAIYGLIGWGFMSQIGGAVIVFWELCSKQTGLQGSTLSSHHMTSGFGPFELPIRGLLQKGQDHSPAKVC